MSHRSLDLQQRIGQIEKLVEEIQSGADPAFRAYGNQARRIAVGSSRPGLNRMLEMVYDSGPAGEGLIDGLAADPLVSSLLLLHGLHPLDFDAQVGQGARRCAAAAGIAQGQCRAAGHRRRSDSIAARRELPRLALFVADAEIGD